MTPIDVDKVEGLLILGKELMTVLLMESDLLSVDAVGNIVEEVSLGRLGEGCRLIVDVKWVDTDER